MPKVRCERRHAFRISYLERIAGPGSQLAPRHLGLGDYEIVGNAGAPFA
jgi:hypothetical protein